MNKKTISTASALLTLAFAAGTVFAMPARQPASVQNSHGDEVASISIPGHAIELAPNIFSLGTATDVDGAKVEGYAIVLPARPENPGGDKNNKKNGSSCYAFLAKDARWKETESYVINTANGDGMSSDFVSDTIAIGTDKWEAHAGFNIFGTGSVTSDILEADNAAPDGSNEVYIGSLDNPNTIAVTIVWGIFGGPPSARELREWDMVFNGNDYTWGDATINPSLMDLENIAVHEIGHAAGLGHPDDSCTEETMFRFAANGETKKRDLNSGDIEGITKLYR